MSAAGSEEEEYISGDEEDYDSGTQSDEDTAPGARRRRRGGHLEEDEPESEEDEEGSYDGEPVGEEEEAYSEEAESDQDDTSVRSNEDDDEDGVGEAEDQGEDIVDGDQPAAEEKEPEKPAEPWSVPTTGAFYMHDDRGGDSSGGARTRKGGGKKLWEPEEQWLHDKFEQLNLAEDVGEPEPYESRGGKGKGGRGKGGRGTKGKGKGGRGNGKGKGGKGRGEYGDDFQRGGGQLHFNHAHEGEGSSSARPPRTLAVPAFTSTRRNPRQNVTVFTRQDYEGGHYQHSTNEGGHYQHSTTEGGNYMHGTTEGGNYMHGTTEEFPDDLQELPQPMMPAKKGGKGRGGGKGGRGGAVHNIQASSAHQQWGDEVVGTEMPRGKEGRGRGKGRRGGKGAGAVVYQNAPASSHGAAHNAATLSPMVQAQQPSDEHARNMLLAQQQMELASMHYGQQYPQYAQEMAFQPGQLTYDQSQMAWVPMQSPIAQHYAAMPAYAAPYIPMQSEVSTTEAAFNYTQQLQNAAARAGVTIQSSDPSIIASVGPMGIVEMDAMKPQPQAHSGYFEMLPVDAAAPEEDPAQRQASKPRRFTEMTFGPQQ
ncbi:hypothetical protein CYMTET_45979 [Cymbomonas tetramitiformis]|uniref:Btz domain-containing protein n=1 Tax=Cymbomonas tetramitiformis TaxID=36881 RepID=A0AAE0BYW9_9CHLO|nr:hypothetical protein CYMTET_45979 [Cymbomonas tetramitiformis]